MYETFLTTAAQWNQRTSERRKLQQAHLSLLVVIVFIAGIISLFNGTGSRRIMYVALALVIAYVANILVWAVVQTFLIARLPRPARPAAAATTRRSTTKRR